MTQTNNLKSDQSQYFRFQVFQGEVNDQGKLEKTKTVGMSYLKDGQNIYTLRLWTFLNERFYIISNKNDPSKYLILTREPNKNPLSKNKYFWNIVGNGTADSSLGVITLNFDLFEKPIFMNMFPESSAFSTSLPDPVELTLVNAA